MFGEPSDGDVPGSSRNRAGRPKGRPSVDEIMLEEAARLAKVKIGDKVVHIDKDRALTNSSSFWAQRLAGRALPSRRRRPATPCLYLGGAPGGRRVPSGAGKAPATRYGSACRVP